MRTCARALDAALFMIFSNNGERCTAGSRILVQKSIYARLRRAASPSARSASRSAIRSTRRPIIGPMISPNHLEKVRRYIELGPKEGATLMCGGSERAVARAARSSKGNFVKATVFADVDNRMRIAQEEIFGPVACLIPFEDEADAIAKANDIAYGLSSYVWSENLGRAHRVAAAIEAGMCFVNSQNVRDLRQPFGGTKASGMGREGGTWSYEVFLEPKNVCVSLGSHPIPATGPERWTGFIHEPVSDAEIPVRHQSRPRTCSSNFARMPPGCLAATSSAPRSAARSRRETSA